MAAPVTACAQALLQFPKNAGHARFRQTGGSPHRYILPWVKIGSVGPQKSCAVVVEMIDPVAHEDDTSSWSAITAIGSILIQACSVPGTGFVGGWALAGDEQYMNITIMNSRGFRATGADNNTATTTALGSDRSDLALAPDGSDQAASDSQTS